MGQMTRVDIINEGMLLAGRDDIGDRAAIWLQTWLDSVANSWPWPQNVREKYTVTVPQGATTLSLGNGDNGVTAKILRIFDNCWLYTSTYQQRQQLRIRQFLTQPEGTYDPARTVGQPTEARISQPNGFGKYSLTFYPIPEKDYLMVFDYLELPATLGGDGEIPWYPNDITMIQFVTARCMLFDDGPTGAYQAALAEVADMLKADRIRYGTIPGQNDVMQLDSAVFR